MASNDTAALVVALSAQLTKFEKDMKGAVDIARKRTTEIEGSFGAVNKNIQTQLSGFATTASRQLGPAGEALLALGPAGLAAAGAIGAIILVATYASAQVNALAARAGQMRDFADTVELSVERVQALVVAGADVGLSSEKVETGIGRMVGALEELRNGSGKAYDAIRKISPELVVQLQQTRDTERSIDLLAKAYARMDAAQRLTLSRGLFGRDPGQSRLLGQISEAGSLEQLQSNLSKSITLTAEQAKKLDDLRDASERLRNSAWEKFWSIGAERVLQNQKESAEQLDWIATKLKAISEISISDSVMRLVAILFGGGPVRTPFQSGGGGGGWGTGGTPADFPEPISGPIPLPRGRPAEAPGGAQSMEARLTLLREQNALLGDAITQREQLTQKELEAAAAIEKDSRLRGAATRGLEAYEATLRQAFVATLQRLGVASEQEIVDTRLAQLQKDKIKFGLTENQVQQATVVILREAKQAAEALEVRRAYLPGLKQLELDAKNVRKSLDELGVNGMRAFEDGLVDIISRTKSVSDAFRDMVNSIIKDIARMLIRQSITGPLAGLLGGLVGNPDAAKIAAAGALPEFAGGGVMRHDGLAMLHANETIFTPDQLRALTRGGIVGSSRSGNIIVGDTHLTIMGNADDQTIAQIRSELSVHRQAIAQQAKSMRSAAYGQRTNVRLSS